MAALPESGDLWRVAALSMMAPAQLSAVLQGESAAAWVTAAAHCGFPEAQLRLGRMLLKGEGVARDAEAALACFRSAAERGDAAGHNMLGRCFENGWGTVKDFTAAASHYRIAAASGLDWALYNLGHMLLSGSGVPCDRDEAFACYAEAAARGHVRAMNLVGRCFEEGWGVGKSRARARDWYRRSAEGGYFRGAYNYADMLAGEGCLQGAHYWFARALATAPEPTRSTVRKSLAARPHRAFQALAEAHTSSRSAGRATRA